MKRVIIVGGGFGGIRTALDLARLRPRDLEVVLVSDRAHFEYYPALYRVVVGGSAAETAIPLGTIFRGTKVKLVLERIASVDLTKHTLRGEAGFEAAYDYLVLALGSESAYFNIPGLAEHSYTFKSSYDALALKHHIENNLVTSGTNATNLVLVGGGPAGVELAGELAAFTRRLAAKHGLEASRVSINLFEAAPRLLPMMSPRVSERVRARLQLLGVNIFVNRAVMREEETGVLLKDMEMATRTVIWTAGVKPNALYNQISGLSFDKRGRVIVNEYCQPPGFPSVFVIGDGAAVEFGGLAQTALQAGAHVAKLIANNLHLVTPFRPHEPAYSMPVGAGWAATVWHHHEFYGRLGWWLRRAADLRFFLSFLPLGKALRVFLAGNRRLVDPGVLVPTLGAK